MTGTTRRSFLWTIASSAVVSESLLAQGPFPSRPITLVVPNPAGGGADVYARGLAAAWGKILGQSIVVENLGGGGGAIAAQRVRRADPDGYTLLFATTPDLLVTPIVNPTVGYTHKDFTPLAVLGTTPFILVARPGLDARNLLQVLAAAKQRPGALSVGVSGAASAGAIVAKALNQAAHVELLAVPYKGATPMLVDVAGGQLDLAITSFPSVQAYLREGKIVPIAGLAAERLKALPDMPTASEVLGTAAIDFEVWAGIAAPAGLAPAVAARLESAIQSLVKDAEFNAWRLRIGDTPASRSTAADFAKVLARDEAEYRRISAGMKFE